MIAFWIPPPRTPATARANTSPRKSQEQIGDTHQNSIGFAALPATENTNSRSRHRDHRNQEQRCINTGRTSYNHHGKAYLFHNGLSRADAPVPAVSGKCQILGIRIIRAEIFCKCRYKQKQCCKHKKKDKLCFCMIFPDFLLPDCNIIFSTHALSPPSRTLGSR